MLEVRYLRKMIGGVPVVAAPAEIDVTVAEELRALLRAHQRAAAEGGELRLVLPADGAIPRTMTLACLDRVIPCFPSLPEALAPTPARRGPAQLIPSG